MSLQIPSIDKSSIFTTSSLSTKEIDPAALQKAWQAILAEGGQQYLSPEFIQAIHAKFSDLTQKMSALEQAILDQDTEKIAELTKEVNALKTDLNAIINGSSNPPVLSLTERVALLKELEENSENLELSDYNALRQALLTLDRTQTITPQQFQEKLTAAINRTVAKKSGEASKSAQEIYENSVSNKNMMLHDLAIKVIQAGNYYQTIDSGNLIENGTQENSESNSDLKRVQQEGYWDAAKAAHHHERLRNERTEEFIQHLKAKR